MVDISQLPEMARLLRADFVLSKDPWPLYYKTPCLFDHQTGLRKVVVRTNLVLSKMGQFLSKTQSVGVGAFSSLPRGLPFRRRRRRRRRVALCHEHTSQPKQVQSEPLRLSDLGSPLILSAVAALLLEGFQQESLRE